MEDKRVKFMKIFANIPDKLREEIIVIIKEKPYTWNAAYIEIRNNTELGKEIFRTLEEMGII